MGIFKVDCSEAHRVLNDRIAEIDYLLDQRFLSRMYQVIHELEQDLAIIRTLFNTFSLKTNSL